MRAGQIVGLLSVGLVASVLIATHAGAGTPTNLRFIERGGGLSFVDNAPKARHQYDFSAGDIVIVSRTLDTEHGGKAGTLRLVCVATTPASQHCTGAATLAGGTIEFAGLSSATPVTTVAVVGGTGKYAGARGTSTSRDRSSGDVADEVIELAK